MSTKGPKLHKNDGGVAEAERRYYSTYADSRTVLVEKIHKAVPERIKFDEVRRLNSPIVEAVCRTLGIQTEANRFLNVQAIREEIDGIDEDRNTKEFSRAELREIYREVLEVNE